MRSRLLVALVFGGSAALVVFVGLLGVGRAVAVRADLPPTGPTCEYEVDTGSGTAGTGTEEIDWFPLPERLCRATTGAGAGGLWPPPHDPDAVTDLLLRWALSALVAVLAGGVVAAVVVRRPGDEV